MSVSLPQVSWDSRSFAQRLRRSQLYKALDNFNVPYPPGSPKVRMLQLLEANGIGDHELMQWYESFGKIRVINGQDENGNPHREYYPELPAHESARDQARGVNIDYDAIIAEKASEVEKADAVIDDQALMIKTLMARIESLEQNNLPMEKMTPPQLKALAKRRGVDVGDARKKHELLKVLQEA